MKRVDVGMAVVDLHEKKSSRYLKTKEWITSLAFSPRGILLTAVDSLNTIYVWHTATGKLLGTFTGGHFAGVSALAFSPDGKTLAAADRDTTILLWDVAPLLKKLPPAPKLPPPLAQKKLEELWQQVGSDDAALAWQAMCQLCVHGEQTVQLLKDQLKPAAALDHDQIAKWIAQLNDNKFAVRSQASAALEKLGNPARPALLKARDKPLSLEHRLRIEELLKKLAQGPLPPEQVKMLRAIELLEMIGTPTAREVLAALTRGAPEARLTQEAKGSLLRLESSGQ